MAFYTRQALLRPTPPKKNSLLGRAVDEDRATASASLVNKGETKTINISNSACPHNTSSG